YGDRTKSQCGGGYAQASRRTPGGLAAGVLRMFRSLDLSRATAGVGLVTQMFVHRSTRRSHAAEVTERSSADVTRRGSRFRGLRGGSGAEEVVPLVVDQDERRKVLDFDLPDRFHAQLGEIDDL